MIRYIWQLPQTIAALIFIVYLKLSKNIIKIEKNKMDKMIFIRFDHPFISGFSLGEFIFLKRYNGVKTLGHEKGHSRQSRILGVLYIPIVAIPSVINNLRARKNPRIMESYYRRFPEKWADKLGGVIR